MTCSIDGCDLQRAPGRKGWCNMHYLRWKRNGDPLVRKKRGNGELTQLLRDAAKATTTSCIEIGYRRRPSAKVGAVSTRAARLVWMMAHGDPGMLYVLHTCDNKLCINISHLYLGTPARNVLDMVERNRESRPSAKLTPAEVVEIRQRHVRGLNHRQRGNSAALAAEYGVSRVTINAASRGATWRKVPMALLAVVVVLAGCGKPTSVPTQPVAATMCPDDCQDLTDSSTTTTSTTTSTTGRPAAKVSRGRAAMPRHGDVLDAIARCEGYPRYVHRSHPGESSASGKYGYLDSTWNGYGGYASAKDAPESVQDERAAADYARLGTKPWQASRGCWG